MKILVVEASMITQKLMERNLTEWGYEVISCMDELQSKEVLLSNDCPRLALIDWSLPEINGLELCRMVRSRNRDSYIFTILLTAKDKPEDIVQGLNAGADDYIVKPFNPQELRVRLRTGERIIQLQNDLIKAREQLQQSAITDSLTGLFNRRAFFAHIQQEILRSKRKECPLGLIMLDIDNFKTINDTYGHISGDHILREAARRIKDSIREYDIAGRYGGEEFLVQAPDCDESCTRTIAERIRIHFQEQPFVTANNSIPITISAGYMAAQGKIFDLPFDKLLHHIDRALYQAKRKGRNRVESAGELEV